MKALTVKAFIGFSMNKSADVKCAIAGANGTPYPEEPVRRA